MRQIRITLSLQINSMKIRIRGNSVRFRLTKTEIATFGKQGFIEEKTEFGENKAFYYSLQRKAGISGLEADFSGNRISLFVPEPIAREWTTTEAVGFENRMNTGGGQTLFLLIEKDFACIDHTTEDQSDHYPNPNKVC